MSSTRSSPIPNSVALAIIVLPTATRSLTTRLPPIKLEITSPRYGRGSHSKFRGRKSRSQRVAGRGVAVQTVPLYLQLQTSRLRSRVSDRPLQTTQAASFYSTPTTLDGSSQDH